MSGISSLRNSSLFASLPDSELEEVAACLVTRHSDAAIGA